MQWFIVKDRWGAVLRVPAPLSGIRTFAEHALRHAPAAVNPDPATQDQLAVRVGAA